ncbi:methyltransferase domain-containing protein [Neorhodopirellula pilleata]|uniref:C-methyltransferase domain-containing protein n=1 Tax=Neorhodopirellula pilleata TaxID=2714738 RepID=A0A5C6AB06_9BACT|nr:methyltransferase domain-containing protein [Neorhodopirellula pilleata]TWT96478.1 hypothetical protein Pla100_29590 [Neorhodopirellula pilleata]
MTNLSDHRCVACEGVDLFEFYQLTHLPADTGSLASTKQEAVESLSGELRLAFCRTCGFVHNVAFNPDLVRYSLGYDASLCHSPGLAIAMNDSVHALVNDHQLEGRSILEIGCGQAHLLRSICQHASVKAVGIDPTTLEAELQIGTSQLRLIRSSLQESHRELIGDLIICVSVIEDIAEPLSFLQMLRSMIGDRKTSLHFELFDGFGAIDAGSVWSPHYEQCNYFSESTICHLFRRAGFNIVRSGRVPSCSSYLYVDAEPSEPQLPGVVDLKEQILAAERFESETRKQIHHWSSQLHQFSSDHKRVFLWGSGGKAISFLSLVPGSDSIEAVVDVNPNRQGLYIPKSGHLVISPEELRSERPDVIIISNPAYQSEIELELLRQGIECLVVAA